MRNNTEIIHASGAETDVFGTGGLCGAARSTRGCGGGGGEQQPQKASFRLLKKMAGRLRSSELGGLGAFMM